MSLKTDFRVTLESFTTKELMNLIQIHANLFDKSHPLWSKLLQPAAFCFFLFYGRCFVLSLFYFSFPTYIYYNFALPEWPSVIKGFIAHASPAAKTTSLLLHLSLLMCQQPKCTVLLN